MSHWQKRRPHQRRLRANEDYETCPDCSARDAVSFVFGHTKAGRTTEKQANASFVRSSTGLRLSVGCDTCEGTGTIRVEYGKYPRFKPRASLPGARKQQGSADRLSPAA